MSRAVSEPEALSEPDLLGSSSAGPAAVRGGALRILGFVGSSLIALGSGAVLYRHLGDVQTGRYTTAVQLVALVAGASDLGLTAIGMRELANRRGQERLTMARDLLGLRLVVTTLGVLAVASFALLAYGTTLAFGVLLAGLGLVFQVWQGTLAIPLMTDLRFGWTALFEFIRQLLTSCLIVALVISGAGLLAFLATPIPAAIAVLALTVAIFRRELPAGIRFDIAAWRRLLGPILTYAVAVAASALYFRVALLLVSIISNGHQLGYFSVSFNIIAALFSVPPLLVSSAFPIFSRAARDDHERLAYAIERVFEVSLAVGAWFSLAIALGAHFAIEVIGGRNFEPAGSVLAIQGISVGATFVGTVWGFGLLSLGRHRTILLFNLFVLVSLAVVVAIMTSLDGARGAAIGASAVELMSTVVGSRLLARNRVRLAPSLRIVPKVACALLLAAAPALIPVDEPARVAISGLIYLGALGALRALPAELIHLLPRARP